MKYSEEEEDDLMVRKQVIFNSPPSIAISSDSNDQLSNNSSGVSPYKTPKKNLLHSLVDDEDSQEHTNVTSKDVENMRNFATQKNFLSRSQSSSLANKKRRTNSFSLSTFSLPKPDEGNLAKTNASQNKENFRPSQHEQAFLNLVVPIPPFNSPTKKYSLPNESQCSLPIIKGSHADLCTINHSTMRDVLNGNFKNSFDEIHIIDCRYRYEYEGGHIEGAVNIPDVKDLETNYITSPIKKNIAIIFYCEFSSKRGPSGYRNLRTYDRKANIYPQLHYPEVYLLEGGYKNFFENCKDLCDPPNYVEMNDKRFGADLKVQLKEISTGSFKRSRSLTSTSLPCIKNFFAVRNHE